MARNASRNRTATVPRLKELASMKMVRRAATAWRVRVVLLFAAMLPVAIVLATLFGDYAALKLRRNHLQKEAAETARAVALGIPWHTDVPVVVAGDGTVTITEVETLPLVGDVTVKISARATIDRPTGRSVLRKYI
jgi:hypothetical protein